MRFHRLRTHSSERSKAYLHCWQPSRKALVGMAVLIPRANPPWHSRQFVGVVGMAVAIPHKVVILWVITFDALLFLLLEFLLQERKDRSAVDNLRLQLCDCGIEGVCCNC